VIRDWVEKNITKILGFEDEFLVNFVMNLLENQADDPRKIELQLRGNIKFVIVRILIRRH